MRKGFRFFLFLVMVALLIAVLKVINWLPTAIQKDTMKRYRSIEDVRAELNIKDIYLPLYFHESLVWPPSEILAQGKPFIAIVMEFKHAEKGDIALIISQAASRNFMPDEKIKIIRIYERVNFYLKGRKIYLDAGVCRNDEPCSMIAWDEGMYRINVTAKLNPPELVKIVESMLR